MKFEIALAYIDMTSLNVIMYLVRGQNKVRNVKIPIDFNAFCCSVENWLQKNMFEGILVKIISSRRLFIYEINKILKS